jgi:hypothetical protein
MNIKEAIKAYGLEFLRGKKIRCGDEILFIHDACLDAEIEDWADEPENAYRISRFYGGEVRDAKLVKNIYSHCEVLVDAGAKKGGATDQQAQEFAARINTIIGTQSCEWCKYSRAWFTYLPLGFEQVAQKVADLLRSAGATVTIGEDAMGEQIQVSARV